jgi:predicted transcriptional regulator
MRKRKPTKAGEGHYRARLSDAEVELMRSLWDEGLYSYRTLAEKFEVPKGYVRDIVKFRRR